MPGGQSTRRQIGMADRVVHRSLEHCLEKLEALAAVNDGV
jgi:hypothetical protein